MAAVKAFATTTTTAAAATIKPTRQRVSKRLTSSTFTAFALFATLFCAIYSYWEFWRYERDNELIGEDPLVSFPKNHFPRSCRGKEKYLDVLVRAGLPSGRLVKHTICSQLPTQEQVAELYGSEPIIHGLDRCEQYRANLIKSNTTTTTTGTSVLRTPMVRVTGLFNTGTNAFHMALHVNLDDGSNESGVVEDPHEMERLYGVPWFKHFPLEARNDWIKRQNADTINRILTIVLVRDPYRWMQSMCKASYTVQWKRVRGHCPNLVPSAAERKARPRMRHASSYPVLATFGDGYKQEYESLASMWSQWNRAYFEADFPRLIVRFEDVIYNAEQVMNSVAECAGLSVRQPYLAMLRPSKGHGDSSGLLSAMIKYGTDRGWSSGLLPADLEYSKTALDKDLMRLFHYKIPKNRQQPKEDIGSV